MKALGLVTVSYKKIFENCILTQWPTYATMWNGLNKFGRTPRDHSCEVWSKSNEQFQRKRCLSKKFLDDGRRTTDDDGQRPVTIAHPKHFVLRWAKKADTPNAYSSIKNNNWSRGLWGPLRGHGVFSERLLLNDS